MKKKYKKILFIIAIIIIIVILMIGFKVMFDKNNTEYNIKVVDTILDFSYTLDERDTLLMKDNYNELKKILKEKDIDYENYAKTLAKLFVIDLYTIDNKVNKYDVPSLEYVYPSKVDNFKLNVEDTIYKLVIDNTYKKRNQELPIVSSIDVSSISNVTYKIEDEETNAYKVNLTWDYEVDLGYDKSGELIIIKEDKKLYVVDFKGGEVNEKVN